MAYELKVRKIGNSYGVVLPKEALATLRVKEGDKFVSRGTNLYWPIPKNDKFEFHPNDTIYQCTREEINGTHGDGPQKRFTELWNADMKDWDGLKAQHDAWKGSK